MMRSFGIAEFLSTATESLLALFAVLTQLGDVWFLLVLVSLVYWLAGDRLTAEPRRTGAFLIGLALSGFVLTIALKNSFALPRPPGADTVTPPTWLPVSVVPVFINIATGTGFGFPSGHALGTTVVYGGLAIFLDVWDRSRRWVAAALIVTAVSFSRLALGVHYFVDVVVGAAVGVLFLALVVRVVRGRPSRMFALAVVVSALAVVAAVVRSHPSEVQDALTGLSASLGGLLAWRHVGVTETPVSPPLAAVGLLVAGGLWVGTRQVNPPLAVVLVAYAVAVGFVVAYPRLVAAVRQ